MTNIAAESTHETITLEELSDFVCQVFLKLGCPIEDAKTATEVLLAADLRGIDSHGVARLSGYIRLWENERVNTTPNIRVTYETPSTGVVDGDRGLGLVVAPFAMRTAMKKAAEVGSGWISVKNSNHFGIAGYHAMMGLAEDMIGFAMTNASALVSPTFSREKLLGTNPIAVAIPANTEPPFVADFATTTTANGKLEILQRDDREAPLGWVQDKDGHDTRNSSALKEGGSLLPLGSNREHGSHKGYCLGAIVDIFSGVLSGANYGPWVPPFPSYVPIPDDPVGDGIGHFLGAMRIDGFRPAPEFKSNMDTWIRRFRESTPVDSEQSVLIPGDPEREMEYLRRQKGIPIHKKVLKDLQEVGSRFGVTI